MPELTPAEEIRSRYVDEAHMAICEDSPEECQEYGGKCVKAVDALADAGLLPTGEEWAIRYETKRASPSMEGETFDTVTLTVGDEGPARDLIANGVPMSGLNRRVVSRPAFDWRETVDTDG